MKQGKKMVLVDAFFPLLFKRVCENGPQFISYLISWKVGLERIRITDEKDQKWLLLSQTFSVAVTFPSPEMFEIYSYRCYMCVQTFKMNSSVQCVR